jgi:Putative phage serine protease XkdF
MARIAKRLTVDIRKVDDERQQIFGIASLISQSGSTVTDRQGDRISAEELEKAVYRYVLDSRDASDSHERMGAGKLIESCVFTVEKQKAMGIDLGGDEFWWVGIACDDAVWAKLQKSKKPLALSIGGTAAKREVRSRWQPNSET